MISARKFTRSPQWDLSLFFSIYAARRAEPVITADIELPFLTHSLLSFICAHERSLDLFNRLIESLAQAFLKSHFLMLLRPASSL